MNVTKKLVLTSALLFAALPALAQTPTVSPNAGRPKASTLDVACIQAAVEKRDSSLISATDVYASAIKSALATRKDALKAAWALTVVKERAKAIRAVWDAWRNSSKAARNNYNEARKRAWGQFYTDRKSCGKTAATEDTSTSGSDAHL